MSGLKEQGDLIWTLTHQDTQEWNVDERWSSQEWKFDELMEVRTGRPVYEQPPGLFIEHDDMDSDTVADSDMSLLSRSFLHRVNDGVRKIQDQSSKDATDIGSICIHGEELPGKLTFHEKYRKRSQNETDVRHM